MRGTSPGREQPPPASPTRRPSAGIPCLLLALLASACAKSDAAWIAELDDPDPFVRGLAALALSQQAPQRSAVALPVLLETVDRVELGLQDHAEVALARVAPFAVEGLIASLLADELMTLERRRALLDALIAAGPAAAAAIVAAVQGPAAPVAGELGVVMVRIGEPSVPHLAALLEHASDPTVLGWAAWLLGQIGPSARPAAPALRALLEHPDPRVGEVAADALFLLEDAER